MSFWVILLLIISGLAGAWVGNLIANKWYEMVHKDE